MEKLKRPVYILLVAVVLLSSVILPVRQAHAWSAVVVDASSAGYNSGGSIITRLYNVVQSIMRTLLRLGAKSSGPQLDMGSHQLMIRLAYECIKKDPAFRDQEQLFPSDERILGWEGVVVTDAIKALTQGGSWRDPDRGGPDANDSSSDSEHYYNPSPTVRKGGGPDAVKKHFSDLLLQMYDQGDFYNRNKPNDKMDHFASWSAHYLADMYVPYHMAGIPASEIKNKLSPDESGPDYLWMPETAVLKDGKIIPGSYEKPPEWSGLDGDFSDIVSYFKSKYAGSEGKDWFDPWYYNGLQGAGPNVKIGKASHGTWESWAHKQVTGGKLQNTPIAYSKGWHNPVYATFPTALTVIEKQAEQAKAFAETAAQETRAQIDIYTKLPEVGFNKAIQGMATLWRASFSALRPSIKIVPDTGNPKLIKAIATIGSVELNDPAVNVKAKLIVDGGTIRGESIHDPTPPVTVTHDKPWVTEWLVDSNNPSACKFKLEAICEYQKIPDLQYAVATNTSSVKIAQSGIQKFNSLVSASFNATPTFINAKTGKEVDALHNHLFDFEHMMGYGDITPGTETNQLVARMERDDNMSGGQTFHETYTVTMNFDDRYQNVTSFVWKCEGEERAATGEYKTISVRVTGNSIPRIIDRNTNIGVYEAKGEAVCTVHKLQIEIERVHRDGTIDKLVKRECKQIGSGPYIYFQLINN